MVSLSACVVFKKEFVLVLFISFSWGFWIWEEYGSLSVCCCLCYVVVFNSFDCLISSLVLLYMFWGVLDAPETSNTYKTNEIIKTKKNE